MSMLDIEFDRSKQLFWFIRCLYIGLAVVAIAAYAQVIHHKITHHHNHHNHNQHKDAAYDQTDESTAMMGNDHPKITAIGTIKSAARVVHKSLWLLTSLCLSLLQDCIENTPYNHSRPYIDQFYSSFRPIRDGAHSIVKTAWKYMGIYSGLKPRMERRDSGHCVEDRFNGKRFVHHKSESQATLACVDNYVAAIKHGDIPRFSRSNAKWRFMLHHWEHQNHPKPSLKDKAIESGVATASAVKDVVLHSHQPRKKDLYFPKADRKFFGRQHSNYVKQVRPFHQ